MKVFRANVFPTAGVGIEYKIRRNIRPDMKTRDQTFDPILEKLSSGRLEPFDYLEFQPPHFILLPQLYEMVSKAPVLVHVSNLSLGSIGIPMDQEFLKLTKRLVNLSMSPWISEHISWSRFRDGDTRHFILPFLDKEVADTIVGNALLLRKMTGVPLLLENVPRTFALNLGRGPSEFEFINDVVERSNSGLLLDVESALKTAKALGYDLGNYLRQLPVWRVIEIHIGNPIAQWEVLQYLLENGPVKAVTVDADFAIKTEDGKIRRILDRIRSLLGGVPVKWNSFARCSNSKRSLELRKSQNSNSSTDVSLEKEGQGTTEFRLNEAVAFRLKGKNVLIQEPIQGVLLEFPERLFPVVEHFFKCRPLSSAFLLPCRNGHLWYREVFSLVKALLENRILLPNKPLNGNGLGFSGGGLAEEIWPCWGSSLNYYLGSRTHAHTNFLSLGELESRLATKAKIHRQPSSFKDYAVHPIQPLENPLMHFKSAQENRRFLDVLVSRRTARAFSREPLAREELSKVLYFTWGSTAASKNSIGEDVFLRKTSPSGGSLHSAEVYPIVMNVQGVNPGVYHYSVRRHNLELLSREDPRSWLGAACGGQKWVCESAVVFVSTAVLFRMAWKYQSSRAFRVVLHDIGHLSQTFCLVATWLGLGSFTTGALRDEIFEKRIGLNHLEEPVFLLNGTGKLVDNHRSNDRPRQAESMHSGEQLFH